MFGDFNNGSKKKGKLSSMPYDKSKVIYSAKYVFECNVHNYGISFVKITGTVDSVMPLIIVKIVNLN